jgi:hypothetical protein
MGKTCRCRRLKRAALSSCSLLLGLLVAVPALGQPAEAATSPADPVCEQAGRLAERAHELPAGILVAIGLVESGRWDPARRRVVPWPWAIDAAGDGKLLDSKAEAVAQTTALRAAGVRNIDVGCFQIDLTSHPAAFADLDQAFDPFINADYAAWFLKTLYARAGSWEGAVAAYHSMRPERGTAYRQQVFANWTSRNRLPGMNVASGPLVVEFASGARMQIWTPANVPSQANVVIIGPTMTAMLPRVIIGMPDRR